MWLYTVKRERAVVNHTPKCKKYEHKCKVCGRHERRYVEKEVRNCVSLLGPLVMLLSHNMT